MSLALVLQAQSKHQFFINFSISVFFVKFVNKSISKININKKVHVFNG